MISFLFSLVAVYLAWWMLSWQLRTLIHSEWQQKPWTTWDHVKGAVLHVLKQVSPQNNQAQCFVDGELKILNQRRSIMLLSFQRLAVVFVGLVLISTLQIEFFLSLILIGTIGLGIFYKKPAQWIQVAFLAGVFFTAYQWSYYQANQWVFGSEVSDLVLLLSDAKIGTMLGLFVFAVISTLLLRIEFIHLWLASVLFFAGGIAYLNAFSLILGEAFAWSLYWFLLSRRSSQKNKTIQKEVLILTGLTSIVFVFILIWLKTSGFLDIRILDSIFSKKLNFAAGWAVWEILLSVVLMLWGHFRSQNLLGETTDLENIKLPFTSLGSGLFKYRGWLPSQIDFRKNEIERKLQALKSVEGQMGEGHPAARPVLPPVLLQKTRAEVESLKQLLGALSKNTL